jgi:hypothetical protein
MFMENGHQTPSGLPGLTYSYFLSIIRQMEKSFQSAIAGGKIPAWDKW